MKTILTNSRLAALRTCPRKHYLRYELGLSRAKSQDALRLGTVYHVGLEARNKGADADTAVALAIAGYATVPTSADPQAWAVERETVAALLAGYCWRYSADNMQVVQAEQSFTIPLRDPTTGRASRLFTLRGKIDAIVSLPDGRCAVKEYKTTSEDIGADSDYWQRLRCDPQISLYILAARVERPEISHVLYDVTRKPTIRLRKDETPEQFGQRLLSDIGERPDYYYARREIPRLEDELSTFRAELWQQAIQLREHQKRNAWYRNVGRMTCGFCEFAQLCLNSTPPIPTPTGFEILADVNPELSPEGE